MTQFESSLKAFRNARRRASVAATFADATLHTAVYDAREAGLSIDETAIALGVTREAVSRHRREHAPCEAAVPVWGTREEWLEARRSIWAHDPHELADDFVPYGWNDADGQRTVTRVWRGTAHLRDS